MILSPPLDEPASSSTSGRANTRWYLAELLAVCAITVLAIVIRAWRLWDIPSPTDELQSVQRGLAIARGTILPLTDYEPYIGSLWNYVLALGFLIAGPSAAVGRAVTLLVGAATVPAVYLLARELGGRAAALIAALLLATSSAHTLAASHPAWSHSMTALFLTLGLWQTVRCLRSQSGPALLAAAGCLGLALQSHLTMLAALPGVALVLVINHWRWLHSKWLYAAALIGLSCIANIVIFNIATGFESVRRAGAVQAAYARTKGPGDSLLLSNAQRMGTSALRTVSGAIDIRPSSNDYVQDPLVVLGSGLCIAGLAILTARRQILPIFVTVSYASLLLLFNAKYEVIPNSRFLSPLLPLALVCSAIAIVSIAGILRPRKTVGWGISLLLLLTVSAFSLAGLSRRMGQMEGSAQTSRAIDSAVSFVESRSVEAPAVLLDRNLDRLWLDGGGEMYMALSWELYRRSISFADLPSRVVPRTGDTDPCRRQWLIAALIDRSDDVPRWIRSALEPDPGTLPRRFWTFRTTPQEPRAENLAQGEYVVMAYQPPINGSARTVDRCSPGRLI